MQKLNDFPPFSSDSASENMLKQRLTLCLDRGAHGGDFLFMQLLFSLLQLQEVSLRSSGLPSKILLISTNHGRKHYESIFAKQVHIHLVQ